MDSVFGKWEKRRCSTHSKIVKLGSALQFIDPLLQKQLWKCWTHSETWWEETPTQVTISTPSSHTLKNEGIFLTKLILHRRLWETHVFFKKLRKIKSTLSFSGKMQILAPWWKTCKLEFYFWGEEKHFSFSSLLNFCSYLFWDMRWFFVTKRWFRAFARPMFYGFPGNFLQQSHKIVKAVRISASLLLCIRFLS